MRISAGYLVSLAMIWLPQVLLAATQQRELSPGTIAWQSTIQSPSDQYELRGVAVNWGAEVAMITAVKVPNGSRRSQGRLQVWTTPLDARNPRTIDWMPTDRSEEVLAGLHGTRMFGTLVAAGAGKQFFVAVAGADGVVRLVRLDTSDEILVDIGVGSVELRGVKELGSGRILIVGSAGLRPLAAEIDVDGKVLRKWIVGEIRGAVVAAHIENDGQLTALLDTSSTVDPAFSVVRIRADGVVEGRVDRAGQAMDMSLMRDGHYAISYARSSVSSTAVRLMMVAVGVNVELTSDIELLASAISPTRFRLTQAPNGGVLVAGVRDRGLWLARFNSSGVSIWDAWNAPRLASNLELTLGVDLKSDQNGSVLLTYSALISEGRQQRSVVRTLRFNLE